MWPIVMDDTVANLPAGQILTCPRPLCGEPLGIDASLHGEYPPRWLCMSGHSGYFQRADPTARPRAFPPGDLHSSRTHGLCSDCGGPVKRPAMKCLDCRRDGSHA